MTDPARGDRVRDHVSSGSNHTTPFQISGSHSYQSGPSLSHEELVETGIQTSSTCTLQCVIFSAISALCLQELLGVVTEALQFSDCDLS